ncbi:MAG: nitroreductase [Oscillospiraceae bacterium]|nr:nitroreductase [Oscillospiraceae bacterium]
MTVSEAIATRKSIRAYKPDAVDESVLSEIIEKAARTPSWANTQPWEVFIAGGATLELIRQGYADCYKNAVKSVTDIPRPADWPQAARERTMQLRPDMVRDCGDAADQFGEMNQKMFNAPAVIFLCLDKGYSQWSLYDLGAFAQSIVLLAQEAGLATIPAITSVMYPDVLRSQLGIPDNLNIALGIPIGYADMGNGINNFHSARKPLSETVKILF